MLKKILYVTMALSTTKTWADIDKIYAPKKEIIQAAESAAYADFPTKKDLLGVIGVESEFNPKIITGSSIGLMQVCHKSHDLRPKDLFNVRYNIKKGSEILRTYYIELGKNKAAALQAYNLGVTAYRHGKRRYSYVRRVESAKKLVTLASNQKN